MAITEYIDYDEVRAVLGVDSDELSDATLGLALYDDGLAEEHMDIDSTAEDSYKTIAAKPIASRSSAEAQYFRQFHLFSVYAVAKHLLSSLPLFSPKSIGDGDAYVTRFSASPFEATISAVNESYSAYRKSLLDAFSVLNGGAESTSTPLTRLVVSSPSYDPIIGE